MRDHCTYIFACLQKAHSRGYIEKDPMRNCQVILFVNIALQLLNGRTENAPSLCDRCKVHVTTFHAVWNSVSVESKSVIARECMLKYPADKAGQGTCKYVLQMVDSLVRDYAQSLFTELSVCGWAVRACGMQLSVDCETCTKTLTTLAKLIDQTTEATDEIAQSFCSAFPANEECKREKLVEGNLFFGTLQTIATQLRQTSLLCNTDACKLIEAFAKLAKAG